MTPPLSVCILACNEEEQLARCLDGVTFADEIIVVIDSKSSDRSEKLARERASRVEVRRYEGDIEQKSFAASLASHEWVLIIDPDEVMTDELAEELRAAVAEAGEDGDGFELNRLTYHLGRWIRHGDFFPDWTLRLFRRSRAKWVGENPHGRVEVQGAVGRLQTPLQHFSYRDLADQVDRIQLFSSQAAEARLRAGAAVRLSDLVLRPPARFVRAYLLKRGFLDGVPGLVIAVATAFHVFLKYAKAWERQRGGGRSRRPE